MKFVGMKSHKWLYQSRSIKTLWVHSNVLSPSHIHIITANYKYQTQELLNPCPFCWWVLLSSLTCHTALGEHNRIIPGCNVPPLCKSFGTGSIFHWADCSQAPGSARIMDTQGSNTVLTTEMVNFSFLGVFFRVMSDVGVLSGERFKAMEKVSLSTLGILKQTKEINNTSPVHWSKHAIFLWLLEDVLWKTQRSLQYSHLFFCFWPKRRRDGPLWPGGRALPFCWWQSFLEETQHRHLVKQLCPFSCSSVQPPSSHPQHQTSRKIFPEKETDLQSNCLFWLEAWLTMQSAAISQAEGAAHKF